MAVTVRMQHPKLPGQEITVAATAVAHYQASGWEPATSPEPAPLKPKPLKAAPLSPIPADAPAVAGVSASTDSDSETPKRRRTQTPKEETS